MSNKMNILKATLEAMKKAIEGLCSRPKLVLVDGLHSPKINVPVRNIVKGDQLEKTIMAAAILAKVHRDQYMKEVDETHTKPPEIECIAVFIPINSP